jgi:hypothetical protein
MSAAYDSSEFISAIKDGDTKKIDDILFDFPDRLNTDINDETPPPLLYAILLKQINVVRHLLTIYLVPLDLTVTTKNNKNALHCLLVPVDNIISVPLIRYLVTDVKVDRIKYLRSKGHMNKNSKPIYFDPNHKTTNQITPIHTAFILIFNDVCRVEDENSVISNDIRPVLQLLLQLRPDVLIELRDLLVHKTDYKFYPELFTILLDSISIELFQENKDKMVYILHYLCVHVSKDPKGQYEKCLTILLDHPKISTIINENEKNRYSVLTEAVQEESLPLVKKLVDVTSCETIIPLYFAIKYMFNGERGRLQTSIVNELLSVATVTNFITPDNSNQNYLLHAIIRFRNTTMATLIINFIVKYMSKEKQKAIFNVKNENNETPLQMAVTYQYSDIIQIYFTKCNANEKDGNGNTAIMNMLQSGDAILVHHVIPELIEKGDEYISWNEKNTDGNSMLHIASILGYKDIVELLLSKPKVTINIRNNRLQHPAEVALTPEIKELIYNVIADRARHRKSYGGKYTCRHITHRMRITRRKGPKK